MAVEKFVNTGEVLLEVKNLKKYYPIEAGLLKKQVGTVKAVDDVSLYINRNETLGLVGESGCGKTTLGRCILRAIEPTSGEVLFHMEKDKPPIEILNLEKQALKKIRRQLALIFQNPYSSLDPRMTVLQIVAEPLILDGLSMEEATERVGTLLEHVGLEKNQMNRYPHAFSGGQRQRIGIARALALGPQFVVADEAVSALDVSVQAQILNLLQDLKETLKPTFLFIAHDLSVIEHVSDRVGVMYVGHLVELAPTEEIYLKPRHPYTEALLSAIPRVDPTRKFNRILLPGEVANAADLPSGCCFHPRCKYANEVCKKEVPQWTEVSTGHYVACHRAEELDLTGVDTNE
ncbi:MAG: ATP-binding cassette domain-containing protein [Clostridiales bacterium]|nr:ATP-binding cassette domain-containing protein [Clostridiales bacterium]